MPRLELLSCSTNGTLVAAGGGDKVLFWDRRTQVGSCPAARWLTLCRHTLGSSRWSLHFGFSLLSLPDDISSLEPA